MDDGGTARGPRARRSRFPAALAALLPAVVLGACTSSQQKLSGDASVIDGLVHDVLQIDRNPSHYYEVVRDSHDPETFRYRQSEDPYLIDKNVDAAQKLGQAEFARLEGQAQVVDKLSDILLEDPAALAQAHAANSLTRMGVKLPQYRSRADSKSAVTSFSRCCAKWTPCTPPAAPCRRTGRLRAHA